MILRVDELNRIAIDRFISASGLWMCFLAHRYEPVTTKRGVSALRAYYVVIVTAATRKVRKVVRLCYDNPQVAYVLWEDWKAKFGFKPEGAVYADDAPIGLSPLRVSPPIFIQEDLQVLKLNPRGGHIFIREVTPVDEVTARAEAVGIQAVVSEENQPMPTMGIVLKLGPDPLLHEELRVGDIVMFSRFAGSTFMEGGYTYRYMHLDNIIGSRSPEDGLDDLLPANITPEMIQWANDLKRTLDVVAARKPIEPVTTAIFEQPDHGNHNGNLGAVAEEPK